MIEPDVVVIGAGLGGLACAARLARAGVKVLVLERHDQIGGYASVFRRGPFAFDVSLHLIDAVGPGEPHRRVLEALGIADQLTLCRPRVLRHERWPEHDLEVPHGIEPWLEVMGAHFPGELPGLRALAHIGREANAAFHRADLGGSDAAGDGVLSSLGELARKSAAAVIDAHVGDPRLRAMLELFSAGWLGLSLEDLSAAHFFVPWYSYQAFGGRYPLGGSGALCEALAAVVRGQGGAVMTETPVTRIVVERHRVHAIETAGGAIATRIAVCNASPHVARALLAPADFDARYLAKLARFEPSVSCVKLWLGLDRPRPEIDPSDYDLYLRPAYAERREVLDPERQGLSVVLPSSLGPEHVPAGKDVVVASLLVDAASWRSRIAERPRLRDEIAETLITRIERDVVPGLRDMIEVKAVAGPETFERFTGSSAGSIYGWHTQAGHTRGWRLPAQTPIDGLWLAGAWTHPGAGFSSVLSSGERLGARLATQLSRP